MGGIIHVKMSFLIELHYSTENEHSQLTFSLTTLQIAKEIVSLPSI